MKVGFIGSGNMAQAMIQGMLHAVVLSPQDIIISAPSQATRDKMASLGVSVTPDNKQVAQSDIVFLTVKPYLYRDVIGEIASSIRPETIIVTVAPGIRFEQLRTWFERPVKVIRTMPNTPALVAAGVTGYCRNDQATDDEMEQVVRLLESFSRTVAVKESLMEAVSGLSGSGPAYVFMIIESMAQAGIQAGLPQKQAIELAAQTVFGAAKMVLESNVAPATLRDQVCSPGGATIEGVRVMEQKGVRSGVMEAVIAGMERAKELGR